MAFRFIERDDMEFYENVRLLSDELGAVPTTL